VSAEPPPDEARRRLRHDLRTPLTIVTGFAEFLASDRPLSDALRRDYATRIQVAAEELRLMLDDLLEDPRDLGEGSS
jgi:signal transduction histidine kinase